MVKGRDEIGVRGSICESDFIVGAGAPGGVRLPWAKTVERGVVKGAQNKNTIRPWWSLVFISIRFPALDRLVRTALAAAVILRPDLIKNNLKRASERFCNQGEGGSATQDLPLLPLLGMMAGWGS